jgi:hypothetical protein
MRPLHVSGFCIEKRLKMYLITFENNTKMTTIQLTNGMAKKFINDLKEKVNDDE